jgi:hypothetical protein
MSSAVKYRQGSSLVVCAQTALDAVQQADSAMIVAAWSAPRFQLRVRGRVPLPIAFSLRSTPAVFEGMAYI